MKRSWRLLDRDSGAVVVEALEVANTFWSRLKGLQFRAPLAAGAGLLLVPCSSIHTFWMRFSLDVLFLSHQGRVLNVRSGVRPWRIVAAVQGTHAILEVPAGNATVAAGSRLQLEDPPGNHAEPLASLQFLR
jgi:uncharacterized membrane protein (UPF0127 family)